MCSNTKRVKRAAVWPPLAYSKAEDVTAEVSWILISQDILTIMKLIVFLEKETCFN